MLLQITEPVKNLAKNKDEPLSYAIGIDLGTTHSVVALAKSPEDVVVLSIDGSPLVPSCVAIEDGSITIGRQATSKKGIVFSSFKRSMNEPATKIQGLKSSVELSADVLRYIRENAQAQLGKPVTKAVITVPAFFDDTARQATKDAAELAGLEVLRLLSEPTAAALAYGLDHNPKGVYAVYDLGGGTFDFSIVSMKQGVFQVLATGGDTHLGGDDIDAAIAGHWQNNTMSLARQAKEALSFETNWSHSGLTLDRSTLDALTQPFLDRTFQIVDAVLRDAELSKATIDGIVLVGGATRMPLLRSRVADYFGKMPLTNLDPDQIVGRGAALQAHMLTEGQGTLLLDVTPLSLGLETMGGIVECLIPRNTQIPTRVSQEFTTFENGQTAIEFHIVQGERELSADCRSLARFILTGIPALPAGVARVAVTFQLDADGLLSVEALETRLRIKQTVVVKPSYGLSEDQMITMLHDSYQHGQSDMENRLLIESKIDALRLVKYCSAALESDGHLLRDEERDAIMALMTDLQQAASDEGILITRADILQKVDALKKATSTFAAARMNQAIAKKLVGASV